MFTGIIQELGSVQNINRVGNIYKLDIRSNSIYKDVRIGDSVAVNGVCLTAVSKKKDILSFDLMAETIRNTSFAGLKNNDRVNLERSLKAGETLDGHFVLGHIDCAGVIKNIRKIGDDFMISIAFPGGFDRLVVEKGSIAVDGVSLTVSHAGKDTFDVHIIPHTLKSTILGTKKSGDKVNLEFDILGKYIAKERDAGSRPRVTEEFLRSKGF
ncbi:MAG: riboflavin synthase [Candidatus Omnitrophica bacterium]|nr:riboflavin synthase [Candidatus Omnitrophota bacterium]